MVKGVMKGVLAVGVYGADLEKPGVWPYGVLAPARLMAPGVIPPADLLPPGVTPPYGVRLLRLPPGVAPAGVPGIGSRKCS